MTTTHVASIDQLCVNTIRTLAIDAVQKANSGHPGLPLGAAPMAYVLWQRHLNFDPKAPHWFDRDRFVLSAGHGSMLLYALLHLYEYDLSLDDLKDFRQWNAKTPGHPEFGLTPGVEATTGPLGQGSANVVGMAIAERRLANRFNRADEVVVDHYTYGLVSDGDLMEGLSAEAASLAGHLGLGRLICLYDANDVSLDGPNSLHFTEDVAKRYESYGWHVQTVADGDTDLDGIDAAITAAKADSERPSLIIVKTTIGYGSPNKAGSSKSHGSPLGDDEVAATKKNLAWNHEGSFFVPDEAREHFHAARQRGEAAHGAWKQRLKSWARSYPALEAERRLSFSGELPSGWDAELPTYAPGEKVATRVASGQTMNAIAKTIPWFFGGDADLSCSTMTALTDLGSFDGHTGAGRNIHYGVREHAMGAIANGIAYHGGARTFTATFFVFSDYMRPAIRLAAMNHLPVTFVFTHDSIGLGEDGPTHQPVEHLASLRAVPNLLVLRPADPTETVEAWRIALSSKNRPTALVLSRQGLAAFDRSVLGPAAGVARGAYVLSEAAGDAPEVILIATGSEVHLALEAQARLEADKVPTRVVSMPSQELFREQDAAWQEAVLPRGVRARVAIEAGSTFGWERFTTDAGRTLGLDRFGASAPGGTLFRQLGFTVDAVVEAAQEARAEA